MKKGKPKISREIMEASVLASNSWSDLSRRVKGSDSHGNVQTLKRYVTYYKIDISHFAYSFKSRSNLAKPKYTPEQIFKEDSSVPTSVVSRTYRKLYPAKECSGCGIGTVWNGKPLTLQIEHCNGHGTDNRLENMCYLCPNCHYQTDTHGTKRGYSNQIKATPEELAQSYDELGSYLAVGKKFNISDRSIKNIIRKHRKHQPIIPCKVQLKINQSHVF